MADRRFEATVSDGVLRVRRPGTRWLSTGWDGGITEETAAYNLTVPVGFDETAITEYVRDRREAAGFATAGPALLTGVSMEHARCARCGPVCAYATVGLSNPAALPMAPDPDAATVEGDRRVGTVNLLVGTDRRLTDGALATLVATAAEAKTATLLGETGFTGTTSDAILVGCATGGEWVRFSGSATPVGSAARAAVRAAVQASLASRYPEDGYPDSVAAAEYGARTEQTATVEPIHSTDDS